MDTSGLAGANVASLAEAWIETRKQSHDEYLELVASLAEAWIETDENKEEIKGVIVASLAEAWIETDFRQS